MNQDIHIVKRQKGWAVHGEKMPFDFSQHQTQAEAIKSGKELAKVFGRELYIHGRDNKFRERNSYGNDPFPPRG